MLRGDTAGIASHLFLRIRWSMLVLLIVLSGTSTADPQWWLNVEIDNDNSHCSLEIQKELTPDVEIGASVTVGFHWLKSVVEMQGRTLSEKAITFVVGTDSTLFPNSKQPGSAPVSLSVLDVELDSYHFLSAQFFYADPQMSQKVFSLLEDGEAVDIHFLSKNTTLHTLRIDTGHDAKFSVYAEMLKTCIKRIGIE